MTAAAIDLGVAAVLAVVSEVWRRLDWRRAAAPMPLLSCLIRIALVVMAIHYALSALAAAAGLPNGGS